MKPSDIFVTLVLVLVPCLLVTVRRIWRGLRFLCLFVEHPNIVEIVDDHADAICAQLNIEDYYREIKAELWNRLT